jgi:NIMA-interacting peptidyl-prolyl cis-trans isomerase 1
MSSGGLPHGWKLKESTSRPGVVYYITPDGKSQWVEPSDQQIREATKRQKGKRSRTNSTGSNSSSSNSSNSNSSSNGESSKRTKVAVAGKVRASHILVKHKESRRPKSWRQEGAILRTEEEAHIRLTNLRQQLEDQSKQIASNNTDQAEARLAKFAEFSNLARAESDCSSYKNGGDLNYFTFDKMDPAFSKVCFNLAYGDMSPIFKTPSGLHIALRTDEPNVLDEVQVLHLLKKHAQSRRPMRENKPITRTKDEAISELEELLVGLKEVDSNALESTFRQFATSESDCSSRRKGGDLGLFGRGKMQPAFEKAAFSLAVGGMSDLIETASGVHILLRIQ